MQPYQFVLLAAIHSLAVVFMLSINFYLTRKRMDLNSKTDSGKLRLAIAAELHNLCDLYKDNIDALYAGRDFVTSSRLLIMIYRGNLMRLTALAAPELPAVVTAYAAAERAEAYASAHGKPHGQNAFTFGKDRPFLHDLVASYETAKAAALRALRTMGEVDGELIETLRSAGAASGAPVAAPAMNAQSAAA